MRLVTGFVYFAAIAISPLVTVHSSQDDTNLELVLQAQPVKPGAPRRFSLLLLNKTDHNVYIPVPVMDCEDGYDGWLQIFNGYMPFRHAPQMRGPSEGCALDRGGPWPSLLDRIKGSAQTGEEPWRTLHPGEALALRPNYGKLREQYRMICQIVPPGGSPPAGIIAFQNGAAPGTYEFWVKYTPPGILGSGQKILSENTFDIPRKELWSNRLTFVKKN